MDAQDQAIAIIFVKLFFVFGIVMGFSILGYMQGKKWAIGPTGGLLLGMLLGLTVCTILFIYL
jgi:hypothetical protein